MQHRWLLWMAMMVLVAAACSGNGSVIALDGQAQDSQTLQVDVAPDVTELEVVAPDQTAVDTEDILVFEAVEETTEGPACEVGEGCFLDPCMQGEDCLSGWCVGHMGESVCTLQCESECPPGWSCQQVPGTAPDVVFVCVSDHANLCLPCADGNDCKGVAGEGAVCVDYGDEGSFCGGTCATDDDCPWGFSCGDAVTVDGVETQQCVADAGVCPCTTKSVELALWTPCDVTNEFGSCGGKRVCQDEGLSDCDAPAPAAEVCDGLDNDCDGEVDEPTLVDDDYVSLCDDGNPCTKDTCNGELGCEQVALEQGECLDGNPCTVADHCEAGVCVGELVDCDDDNPCTDDVCTETGGCDHLPAAAECDDGQVCTLGDHCVDGACVGEAVDCQCQVDADCAALEDGDLCNGTLACNTSTVPHTCDVIPDSPIACPGPTGHNAPCLAPACDPDTGACSQVPANDGAPCSDGDLCTVGETCLDGLCQGGWAANCNDGNLCTDDSCDPDQGCLHTHNSAGCNDGDVCTTGDVCSDGACSSTGQLLCDDGDPCTADSCDALTGCQYAPADGNCDDGNACTVGDHCSDGQCVNAGLANCDDDNICTTDSCDPDTGCLHLLNNAPCDDGNVCTTKDVCQLGECVGAAPLTCNDDNPCTDDGCDALTGCQYNANDAQCDDGLVCTVDDHCSNGACVAGGLLDCDDDNPCTDDLCDFANGCLHLPNTIACDDSDACTTVDLCAQGECVGSEPPNCDDGNLCTDDSCDAESGCVHSNNALPCDDGDACTLDDVCSDGSCAGPTPLDCDDEDECTTDSCDEELGCINVDIGACCGNGNIDDGEQCDDGNDIDNDACGNDCILNVQAHKTYTAEGRNIFIFKSNSNAALSTYNTFCESQGLQWFVPKNNSDGQTLVTTCYNIDSHHTWVITKNNTSGSSWGGANIAPATDSDNCSGQCSNSGFSGVRKWSSSWCDPEKYGVTKCWDSGHQYDWLVCQDG